VSNTPGVSPRRLHWCAASLLLLLTGCSQVPPTNAAVIPPIPTGGARIWIYRNDGPSESHERPYLRINGQIAGISEPNGAFYRDLPPGHYTVSVDSYGVPYPNQFAQFDLGAGQEAFVKVLSQRERVGGGGDSGFGLRAIFYAWLIPADAARPEISSIPFYGSS
jgi:hypothetical protein